jgi:hypothetical protein
VIYLNRLPSHGRETAEYLATSKSTNHIPLVFIDGEPDKIEKVKQKVPNAIYTTENKLKSILKKFL